MQKYYFYQNPSAQINQVLRLNQEQEFWRQHVYLRYQMMQQARQLNGREDNWNKWQRQYEAWRPPRNLEWQSNIVPPYTTSIVESALSEMVDQTLRPRVSARTLEDVPKAVTLNFVHDYTWEIGDGDLEVYKAIKQHLIIGTTFWQESFLQDKRKVQVITRYDPKTGREYYEEKEVSDFDDCYGEAVNVWDLWVDPDARTMNMGPYKAKDVIRRYIMHIDTFRSTFMGTKWDKWGLVKNIQPSGDANYYQFYKPPQGVDLGSYVEVLFYWCRTPDRLVICAGDIPFYIGPNPYNHKQLPFARGVDMLDPWSIYGKGEPELLESIQDELTSMRRMRLDRQKLDIYKMIFVQNNETLTDQDLIPAPMKPIYVDDANNVKAFEYGDVNPSAYREEMLLKEDGTRVTGIDDLAQSTMPKGQTATQAAIISESVKRRLRTKIWLTSRTLLMEQIRLRVPNIIQFYQLPKIYQITGRDSVERWAKIRQAAAEGRMFMAGGQMYEKKYRTIVTRNKALKKTEDGGIAVEDKRGDNFFMVTPDLLVPAEVGFDYKLSAEPTFPLSRPLMQQKVGELFQHPIILAAIQQGHYDATKIADKIIDINDFDPSEFQAAKQTVDQAGGGAVTPEKMMELASRENELLTQGEAIAGTPYSTLEHTMTHVEFMKSERFKQQSNPTIIENFVRHIIEEQEAQAARTSALGQVPTGQQAALPPAPTDARAREMNGIMGGETKAAMPAMMLGPEGAPDLVGTMGFGPRK